MIVTPGVQRVQAHMHTLKTKCALVHKTLSKLTKKGAQKSFHF